MEQLISRRLPARKAQSGVALIMVLIMLTAMAIAGVALVRVVDSANVISGNFAFRQSTLNIADLGVEAATADLIAIHAGPATARENAWPVNCSQLHDRLPLLSCQVDQPAQPQLQQPPVSSGMRAGRQGPAGPGQQNGYSKRAPAGHQLGRQ
jgi:Tfp pilus assembly protein PilX